MSLTISLKGEGRDRLIWLESGKFDIEGGIRPSLLRMILFFPSNPQKMLLYDTERFREIIFSDKN